MARFTKENARQFGAKGGAKTFEVHGSDHMSAIGKIGFDTTLRRHWKGDKQAFLDYLQRLGWAATDPMPWNQAWSRLREWGDTEPLK